MIFRAAFLALPCLLLCFPARAEEWVEFHDGRVLRIEALTRRDGMAFLELQGGGEIAVPTARIARRERVDDRPAITAQAEAGDVREDPPPREPWREVAGRYADLIAQAAARHGLDPALLTAVAQVESAFDPFAVSSEGACGLLQLLPSTAERFGVNDIFDVEQNIEGGARYLGWLISRYDGNTELALAAYNAGEGAVDHHRGIPPYVETRTYVSQVMKGARLAAVP